MTMTCVTMTNPLLETDALPCFSKFDTQYIAPALDEILAFNRTQISQLIQQTSPTWENTIQPLINLGDKLGKMWSPVSHLHGVQNTPALREIYTQCLPKLSAYSTELGQNKGLFNLYHTLLHSPEFAGYSQAQKQAITHAIRDFKLAGVDLDDAQKERFGEIKKRLSACTTAFSNNVLDATQAWSKLITDKAELVGLPDSTLDLAAQTAQEKGMTGYLITLDFPLYYPVMTYCENRALREELYTAYCTRASDVGPYANTYDNTALTTEILTLRHEMALLLGFSNYAEYSIASKMAESTSHVTDFLHQFIDKSKTVAQQEFTELKAFATEQFHIDTLNAWDVGFYGEKLRQARYDISQEILRPYFPDEHVLQGLFSITGQLFNIEIEQQFDFETYHPSVRFYLIKRDGQTIAGFYFDIYTREHKRGGAWMDECRVRRRLDDGSIQLPIAYLVCNFSPPVGNKPALLTHDEVTTLFHEFGHGLHHMLTTIDVSDVSGINGVPWDAVELPSQFLENWCWEPEGLARIAKHHETGEALPAALLEKMLAAKNFQSGIMMMRQVEFSLFDFTLHQNYVPGQTVVQASLDEIRKLTQIIPVPAFNRFQNSFSHIFAGGYAAGYYSYKWAEVLSADAFSKFEEDGVFNTETGKAFLVHILEKGGSEDPTTLFVNFRGRKPDIAPLLRHCGII